MSFLSRKISYIALAIALTLIVSMGSFFSMVQPAQATPHQSIPRLTYVSGDTWIGTDGEIMSAGQAKQWQYTFNWDKKSLDVNKYLGGFTSDGRINGVVPASINGLPVTNMSYTFYMNKGLRIAPVLPTTITSLYSTFFGTNLVQPPVIPHGVTELHDTFAFCSSLTTAPEIPSSVTDMGWTFANCSRLTKVNAIPESVKIMCYTFLNCTSLKQRPAIPSSVDDQSTIFKEIHQS